MKRSKDKKLTSAPQRLKQRTQKAASTQRPQATNISGVPRVCLHSTLNLPAQWLWPPIAQVSFDYKTITNYIRWFFCAQVERALLCKGFLPNLLKKPLPDNEEASHGHILTLSKSNPGFTVSQHRRPIEQCLALWPLTTQIPVICPWLELLYKTNSF